VDELIAHYLAALDMWLVTDDRFWRLVMRHYLQRIKPDATSLDFPKHEGRKSSWSGSGPVVI
jgi:hypothetical protein